MSVAHLTSLLCPHGVPWAASELESGWLAAEGGVLGVSLLLDLITVAQSVSTATSWRNPDSVLPCGETAEGRIPIPAGGAPTVAERSAAQATKATQVRIARPPPRNMTRTETREM